MNRLTHFRQPLLFLTGLTALLIVIGPTAASDGPTDWQRVDAIVAQVDQQFEQTWRENQVTPSEPARPSEFLRRVWLDVAGRIPQVSVTREFLAASDGSAAEARQARRDMIERLLDRPTYVTHFAEFWQAALIPEATSEPQLRQLRPAFEAWLREQLRTEVAYDELVRSLITAPIDNLEGNPRAQEASPGIFFRVKQLNPANLAAATSRVFLGVRLECAQCHNHPFDTWKQEQFWSLAAFYSGVKGDNAFAMVNEVTNRRRIQILDSGRFVEAAFLPTGKAESDTPAKQAVPREELAAWVTADENPWFAKMAVNRLWGMFFGRGFVDPVDDFSANNPPSHPKVLDLLAREFIASGYDLKFLIRVITSTRAYQLSSRQTSPGQLPPEMFARASVRGLTPRQVFNSLSAAMGTFEPFTVPGQFNDQPAEQEFLDLFSNDADSPLERPTTILQALSLMNGDLIGQGTDLEQSRTLRAIIDYPLMTRDQKIETLYLAALVRRPTESEAQRLAAYADSLPAEEESRALADIYWTLLNSSEFLFNH
ncbi:DUF1553 domain-containing protein [bacterium]|nr:DUF1553 domain-containing protein [bacterium]